VQSQKAQAGDKRMEVVLLSAAGDESAGVICKAVLSVNKGSIGILLGNLYRFPQESKCKGRHISEHAQFKLIEHMIKKERWWTCMLLGMLNSVL
jgi:hypothetical protein